MELFQAASARRRVRSELAQFAQFVTAAPFFCDLAVFHAEDADPGPGDPVAGWGDSHVFTLSRLPSRKHPSEQS